MIVAATLHRKMVRKTSSSFSRIILQITAYSCWRLPKSPRLERSSDCTAEYLILQLDDIYRDVIWYSAISTLFHVIFDGRDEEQGRNPGEVSLVTGPQRTVLSTLLLFETRQSLNRLEKAKHRDCRRRSNRSVAKNASGWAV